MKRKGFFFPGNFNFSKGLVGAVISLIEFGGFSTGRILRFSASGSFLFSSLFLFTEEEFCK